MQTLAIIIIILLLLFSSPVSIGNSGRILFCEWMGQRHARAKGIDLFPANIALPTRPCTQV